jgi:hypothetical protein
MGDPFLECQLLFDADSISVSKERTTGIHPIMMTSKNLFCDGASPVPFVL